MWRLETIAAAMALRVKRAGRRNEARTGSVFRVMQSFCFARGEEPARQQSQNHRQDDAAAFDQEVPRRLVTSQSFAFHLINRSPDLRRAG
jgi:hypothetical protein